FGWQAPDFAHFPMMLAPSGEKLSKRHGSVSVQEYRERGYTPTSVLNYLVRFGWSHGDQEIFSRQDLIDLFDWQSVNKSDGKFDEKKFADVAFEHLKQENLTPLEEYVAGVRPFLEKRGLRDVSEDTLRKAIPGIRDRARTLVDAAHHLDYYFREPPELDPKARDKFMTPAAAEHVVALADALGGVEPWQPDALEQRFREFLEQRGVSMKDASQATRVALSGRSASPPLFEVMAVLGRERSLSRMRRAPALVPGAQAG
ncbi:MAG TPA: glutamate--tRNA ligase family protein, partial [Polyangiaceae bacterium]|nr:glutamate--tRNA ligase family protein [Polyangiaceae bacterium]